jgi:hypothetical protein
MPEPSAYTFSHKEIVALLVRHAGVTEGLWGLQVRFGIGAANVGPTDNDLVPTALVPLLDIGIQKVDKLTNLSVDAAEIAKQGAPRTET